jgi:hypothetical protein
LSPSADRLIRSGGRWVSPPPLPWLGGGGLTLEIRERHIALLFAFLAGGVVLNVLKEELPVERESRFWAFAAGRVRFCC